MFGTPVHYWLVFAAVVAGAVTADIFILHRSPHRVTSRQAGIEIALWIALACVFAAWLYFSLGAQAGLEFVTGYLVEQSLSVDNIFLFLLIFRAFQIPSRSEHKILYSGIAGAIFFRAVFVFAGVSLLHRFRFILYLFGALLVVMGLKMFFTSERNSRPERNWLVRFAENFWPVAHEDRSDKFWIKRSGRMYITPLFLALVAIEATDILFAVDSVPAVLAITRNAFIVYSSNVFAILGLRAMYFWLAGVLPSFRFLHQGLAAILIFVGGEMLISEHISVPTAASLGAIALILAITAALSRLFPANPSVTG